MSSILSFTILEPKELPQDLPILQVENDEEELEEEEYSDTESVDDFSDLFYNGETIRDMNPEFVNMFLSINQQSPNPLFAGWRVREFIQALEDHDVKTKVALNEALTQHSRAEVDIILGRAKDVKEFLYAYFQCSPAEESKLDSSLNCDDETSDHVPVTNFCSICPPLIDLH